MKHLIFSKLFLILTLVFSIAVFNSCDSSDGEPEPNGNGNGSQATTLVGTWKYSKAFIKIQGQTMEVTDPTDEREVIFETDGTYSETNYGTGTYRLTGSAISITTTKNNVTQTIEAGKTITDNGVPTLVKSYTFKVEGNKLTMSMETEMTNMGIPFSSTSIVEYVRKEGSSSDNIVAVTSIALNKKSLTLTVGNSETLTTTILPNNATDKTVTWESSNTTIAVVDNNGIVTAKAAGTATITAKAGDKTATCSVTVTAKNSTNPPTNAPCESFLTLNSVKDGNQTFETTGSINNSYGEDYMIEIKLGGGLTPSVILLKFTKKPTTGVYTTVSSLDYMARDFKQVYGQMFKRQGYGMQYMGMERSQNIYINADDPNKVIISFCNLKYRYLNSDPWTELTGKAEVKVN